MSERIPLVPASIPWVTAAQMVEVDRLMTEVYGIALIQMMEHAGRHLAALARDRFLNGDPRGKVVVVLAGTGGNGGGVLVAARRLAGWGAVVHLATTAEDTAFTPVPATQLEILRRLGIAPHTMTPPPPLPGIALVLDGVIGYRLRGAPRGAAADLIRWAKRSAAPILSLDVPSGLDVTTGEAFDPTIRAAATLTLALPKIGLGAPSALPFVGELYLADIGVPPALYTASSLDLTVPPIFAKADILRVARRISFGA